VQLQPADIISLKCRHFFVLHQFINTSDFPTPVDIWKE